MSDSITYANAIANAIWNDYQIDAGPELEHPTIVEFSDKQMSDVHYRKDYFNIEVSADDIFGGLNVMIYVAFYDSRALVSSRTETALYKVRKNRLSDIDGEVANIKRVFDEMWGR